MKSEFFEGEKNEKNLISFALAFSMIFTSCTSVVYILLAIEIILVIVSVLLIFLACIEPLMI